MVFSIMNGQESRLQSNALLHSYLQTDNSEESESLLTQLLARAAPFIENRLGRKFRVSIRGGRCPLSPDAEDQYSEVNLLLLEKLRKLKAAPREDSIRDFQSYVEQIAENTFSNRLREDHKELRSLKDALRYLLDGRTRHKAFALWWGENGKQVGGFAKWRDAGKAFSRSSAYQQLLDDPNGFARAKLPREDIPRIARAELADAIFRWVGGPVDFDDLVQVIAKLQGVTEAFPRTLTSGSRKDPLAEDDYTSAVEDAPDPTPTPLDILQSKSDTQMVWEDLGRLKLEQRRVLLLQAQHDVIEILLRTDTANLREIATSLEMTIEEIEELRSTGFFSDEQLGRRFRSLKATIIQQRHRARLRMAEWRKRW